MKVVPLTQSEANEFIANHHRHHKPSRGDKFRVGWEHNGILCGVVVVGRPVSRNMDDGKTLEVTRMCTDGTGNACSFLYGKAIRISKLLGYDRLITYTLESEAGSSLKASGFSYVRTTRGGSWSTPSRPRKDKSPIEPKKLWVKELNGKTEKT